MNNTLYLWDKTYLCILMNSAKKNALKTYLNLGLVYEYS